MRSESLVTSLVDCGLVTRKKIPIAVILKRSNKCDVPINACAEHQCKNVHSYGQGY